MLAPIRSVQLLGLRSSATLGTLAALLGPVVNVPRDSTPSNAAAPCTHHNAASADRVDGQPVVASSIGPALGTRQVAAGATAPQSTARPKRRASVAFQRRPSAALPRRRARRVIESSPEAETPRTPPQPRATRRAKQAVLPASLPKPKTSRRPRPVAPSSSPPASEPALAQHKGRSTRDGPIVSRPLAATSGAIRARQSRHDATEAAALLAPAPRSRRTAVAPLASAPPKKSKSKSVLQKALHPRAFVATHNRNVGISRPRYHKPKELLLGGDTYMPPSPKPKSPKKPYFPPEKLGFRGVIGDIAEQTRDIDAKKKKEEEERKEREWRGG